MKGILRARSAEQHLPPCSVNPSNGYSAVAVSLALPLDAAPTSWYDRCPLSAAPPPPRDSASNVSPVFSNARFFAAGHARSGESATTRRRRTRPRKAQPRRAMILSLLTTGLLPMPSGAHAGADPLHPRSRPSWQAGRRSRVSRAQAAKTRHGRRVEGGSVRSSLSVEDVVTTGSLRGQRCCQELARRLRRSLRHRPRGRCAAA